MRALAPVVLVAVAVILAGCGSSSGPSSAAPVKPVPAATEPEPAPAASSGPLDQDLPALVKRAVEMFETISSTIVAGSTDCPAIAGKLRGLQATYEPVITAARKVEADGRGEEIERLLMPHQDRIKAAVESMKPGVEACMGDADFQRAFNELTGA